MRRLLPTSDLGMEADQGLQKVLSDLYENPNMSRELERATLLHHVHSLYAEVARQRKAVAQLNQSTLLFQQTAGQLQGIVHGHSAEKEALLAKISELTSERDTLAGEEHNLRMDKDLNLTEIAALRSQLEASKCHRESVLATQLTQNDFMGPLSTETVSDPICLLPAHLADSPFRSTELGQWIPAVRLSLPGSPARKFSPEEMAIIKRRMQTDRGPNMRLSCGGNASLAVDKSSSATGGALLSLETATTPLRDDAEVAAQRFSPELDCSRLASSDECDIGLTGDHAATSESAASLPHSFVQLQAATQFDSAASGCPGGGCAGEDSETEVEDDTHSPVRQLESTTTAINSFTLEWSDKQHANPVDEDINLGNLRALQVRCVPPNSIDAMPNDHQSIVSPPNLRAVKMEHGAHVDTVCRNSATAEDPKATPVQQCAATQDSRAANAPFNPGTAALDAAGPALAPGEAFGSRIDVALLVVKNEEISASAAELCPSEAAQVASLSPRSQSCHRYSHGLFSRDESCSATRNAGVCQSSEDSDKASSNRSPEMSKERRAADLDEGGGKDGSVNHEVPPVCDTPESLRISYLHVTYCSWCCKGREESQAVALCALCPRVCCRGCLRGLSEKVPRAGHVVLPADKCLCLRWDSNFPQPPKGIEPEAHLLQQLVAHDLSRLFQEEVNPSENPGYIGVITREEMMDLSAMNKKMQKIQYQTTRGRRMFRKDLKQIWLNCWKYAGFAPESDAPVPGIVSCTLILEAMVDKFYKSYIQQPSLAMDEDSWQCLDERNKQRQFTEMVHGMPPRIEQDQSGVGAAEPHVAAAEACHYSGEETETDDEAEVGGIPLRRNVPGGCRETTRQKRNLSNGAPDAARVRNSYVVGSQPTHRVEGGDGREKGMGVANSVNDRRLSLASDDISKNLCHMADVGEELIGYDV